MKVERVAVERDFLSKVHVRLRPRTDDDEISQRRKRNVASVFRLKLKSSAAPRANDILVTV